MSTIPAVSICCTTYNHEKYIRDALDGFLMQKTNFPIEILIHDDASTDHTADIIREYEAKHPDIIKPIYQTENQYSQGKFIWCEYQFPYAKGKYIALCEGDDFWTDPNKLQIQYDFMESHQDYSMCFHKAKVIDEQGAEKGTFNHIEERDYTAVELLEKWTVPTASSFFRAQYTSKIPVNKDFWCADIIVWLTMSQYGKIYAMNKEMSVYRILSTGAVAVLYCKKDEQWLKRQILHNNAMRHFFLSIPDLWFKQQNIKNHYLHLIYTKDHCPKKEALKVFWSYSFFMKIQVVIFYLQYRLKNQLTERRVRG